MWDFSSDKKPGLHFLSTLPSSSESLPTALTHRLSFNHLSSSSLPPALLRPLLTSLRFFYLRC